MSTELTARVVGVQAVVAKYDRLPAQVHARLVREVTRLGIELQSIVKAEKLTGQVLKVRSGRGRRSITRQVTSSAEEIRSRTGTNVGYMRAWEKGFHGPVDVRAHTRRSDVAFGRKVKPFVQNVGPHKRNVDMDPRPFLRPSLEQMRGKVSLRLAAALGNVTGVSGGA